MHSPGEVVPGSRDPGSGGLHRLPGGEVWRVTCACTQASCGCSSSLSVPCPSLGSVFIAAARARLWSSLSGALNPLSSCTRKQRGKKKSLACSAAPDLFPDSLPASCGALAPSGCVHATNPSPLPEIRPKPEPQLPAPPAPVGEQTSLSGW